MSEAAEAGQQGISWNMTHHPAMPRPKMTRGTLSKCQKWYFVQG